MTDLPKQQYLSKDDKGWKLRRQVPANVQELAGKTQWVERMAGVSHREACERAKTFGVRTDAEIKLLEGQLADAPPAPVKATGDEPGFKFELTDHEIDQIAIAYFHELERSLQTTGGYELRQLFPERTKAFDTPKTNQLVDTILSFVTREGSIVLDSFAGSGTTAHSVLNLISQDGVECQFILVEGEDYADDLMAERVRRVITGVDKKRWHQIIRRAGRQFHLLHPWRYPGVSTGTIWSTLDFSSV